MKYTLNEENWYNENNEILTRNDLYEMFDECLNDWKEAANDIKKAEAIIKFLSMFWMNGLPMHEIEPVTEDCENSFSAIENGEDKDKEYYMLSADWWN